MYKLLKKNNIYCGRFYCFISRLNHSDWEYNECLNMKICKCHNGHKLNNWLISPLEVVGRDS